MDHPCIELIRVTGDFKPVFIQLAELLDALKKLILVEQGHIEMLSRVIEGFQVIMSAERLHLASLVLDDADALVHRDAIVKRSR